jgi:magnesium chelatase subunit I
MNHEKIKTLGELKQAGYQSKSIKDELRDNLVSMLEAKKSVFEGVHGYENTVIPDIQRALLSRHNINLLGLRGQAKTKMARQLVHLLDEWIPVVSGSEINDDPLNPLSAFAKSVIAEKGDDTPIEWKHRMERYVEKLATPDVSVADLIGDVDPIKAVNQKLDYSDERVIHFGLVPRSNRCIFVINEMPDLQARIQVALFNVLQEGDVQIRGFSFRMPLDIQFVFTANPEDYTNRGSMVTPLKDRIGSQILTHYPKSIEIAKRITQQEAKLSKEQLNRVVVPDLLAEIIEQLVIEARSNEFVDHKSGVSARLSISAYENLVSTAERRAILTKEKKTLARITDLYGIIPAITGKLEMVYEGEQEGSYNVANILIGKAIRSVFGRQFTNPQKKNSDTYTNIINWFEKGNSLSLLELTSDRKYAQELNKVSGLAQAVDKHISDQGNMEKYVWMEFVLFALSEFSKLSRNPLEDGHEFGDLVGSMLGGFGEE